MYKVNVEIETVVPYKQDRFTDLAKERADKGKTSKHDTWEIRQKQWEEKVYKDKKGCYIPVCHVYHSILNGLAAQPSFVSNKVKLTRNTVKATIFIDDDKMYISKKNFDGLDIFTTVNKNAIGSPRVTTAHPYFNPPLKIAFTISVVQDFLLPEILKEGIARAGLCFGIGAGRPKFGRFIVKKFEVVK